MRLLSTVLALILSLSATSAQEVSLDCDAAYQQIVADKPIDLASCPVEVKSYTLKDCIKPDATLATRPASHMILAIDASGSMAGRVGGETKMKAAKREALAFLSDMPAEIKVGLVVYGHRGNNQDDGKAESCASSELIHAFNTKRRDLKNSIRELSPTGWTPLGGVLNYTSTLITDLPTPEIGDLAPVVYVISDGKETCGGDPVTAAKTLFNAGVKTVVNTIGFAVDAETTQLLKSIADAAGGKYYPAQDAKALRAQLNAIKDAENALLRYEYCVDINAGRIGAVYHNARVKLAGCYQRNNPIFRQSAVARAIRTAKKENAPTAACAQEWQARVTQETRPFRGWLRKQSKPLTDTPLKLIEDYRASAKIGAGD